MVPRKADFASPVRERRKQQRMTQAELSELVGVSRQTIIAVEQGDYAPSVYLALKIARALGGTVEELFTDEAGDRK
ncbi:MULTISPECIES: helix-turn-helix transcriptional regulator [Arthrobacter]|uniref:Helix-turn-helix transcriptional regulator n=1 Tax=Arthrobacter gengyunqii TaxID=2886940 RepID=A0A9X1LZL8_9MICC|nr:MULTISPECIES: helix-turn-helix transcriptional regulator [Arthrobacter]MBO0897226.1 helix-turn-helix transcriptional regulator [Arthrobacter sunyaminii]MCC3265794.1 helix-turn-helix transcriptional regulator [Arthrobacter gengyunqii]MCC3268554.1 helix-turn-helix transcriptional regulator [Arthrobacter gengyunqii]UOY95942.1 helix-turn-helix transcriptional regulator [Arthrobacter gengyunqii]